MRSATCSIWSREMKLWVSGKPGAIQAAGRDALLIRSKTREVRGGLRVALFNWAGLIFGGWRDPAMDAAPRKV